jgi:hypothetical protein
MSMTKWRKMNSAPRDGTPILVGLWVGDKESGLHWEQYVVFYDAGTANALDQDSKAIPYFAWDDFDAWTVIPKPPHWGKE